MLGCNNTGHHPILVYTCPDPYFLRSAQYHGPQYGPDVKFPSENPIFTHVCQARLGKRKVRYLCWAALLVGTSEYSEWIEGGMIRVAQTQKREYANIMVVCNVLSRWIFAKIDANDVDKAFLPRCDRPS